ncbi:YbjN domain-containing protein [Sphingomonas sp. HF-S3]|uniref:YbjN domain-containing protein n=1 Tax=Sphingomonas rustica TaxID=3103142 RepID=A0ABV0B5L3_9SPHN
MKYLMIAAALLTVTTAANGHAQSPRNSATAQDPSLDLSTPEKVAQALQGAGYKALLKKRDDGGAYIESAASGSGFSIEFWCEGSECKSMQFYTWYKKRDWFNTDFANRWNAKYRFVKVAIDADGDLSVYMDISLVGRMSSAHFGDILDWWSVMSDDVGTFIDDEETKRLKKPG